MGLKSAGTDSSKPKSEGLTPHEAVERIGASKLEQRRKLAALPFEEKFRIVVEMRRISDAARSPQTGQSKK
jgi:hypothetical protein